MSPSPMTPPYRRKRYHFPNNAILSEKLVCKTQRRGEEGGKGRGTHGSACHSHRPFEPRIYNAGIKRSTVFSLAQAAFQEGDTSYQVV